MREYTLNQKSKRSKSQWDGGDDTSVMAGTGTVDYSVISDRMQQTERGNIS